MDTKIQPVHLAITFREEWLNHEPAGAYEYDRDFSNHNHPNPKTRLTALLKATHDASHDEYYLWGYWGEYFHCRLQAINPTFLRGRLMNKKEWKKLYHDLRYDEYKYRQHCEQWECDSMGTH